MATLCWGDRIGEWTTAVAIYGCHSGVRSNPRRYGSVPLIAKNIGGNPCHTSQEVHPTQVMRQVRTTFRLVASRPAPGLRHILHRPRSCYIALRPGLLHLPLVLAAT